MRWRYRLRAIAVDPAAWGELLGVGVALADLVPGTVAFDLVGSNELVLHAADAEAQGWDPEGSLVVAHTRGSVDALAADLLALVPDDRLAQVIDPTLGVREPPLVLPTLEVKRLFGEFAWRSRPGVREIDVDPAWVDANIVTVDVPIMGPVTCHRAVVDDVRAVFREIVDLGRADTIEVSQYAGCHYARRTGTSEDDSLSRHSWGIALDVNVDLSQPGLGVPLPDDVIDVFRRHGFVWGGDFLQPDNHHFEWVGT